MEIRIVIDAPTGWKRRVLLYVVIPVALVASTAIIARATVQNVDASWVASGAPVSAANFNSDLNTINANFASLDQRLTILEARTTSDGGYSVNATYCGTTESMTGQIAGGYAGAKAFCVAACNGANTAHMCTTEELLRSLSLGTGQPGPSWISTGTLGVVWSPSSAADCNRWASAESSDYGGAWDGNGAVLSSCDTVSPIACCN